MMGSGPIPPSMIVMSEWQMPQWVTSTSTWPADGAAISMSSRSSSVSAPSVSTAARMVFLRWLMDRTVTIRSQPQILALLDATPVGGEAPTGNAEARVGASSSSLPASVDHH